ncbi:MAG: 4-alpha-glucanotransferase, partial [Xanthomonadales bacterium]|nr:4-alpha-glucanotransferase [Xanthomonadales bacterium]
MPAGSRKTAWPTRPRAGVGLHFTSLPSAHGIGDIADAATAFVDLMKDLGLNVWQVLPSGPTAYGDSPYSPLSAFAGNEMLIGLGPLVRDDLLSARELSPLRRLTVRNVDYGGVIPRKRALLVRAADRFLSRNNGRAQAAFDAFKSREGATWLDDYALFRVLKTLNGERAWPRWIKDHAHRQAAVLRKVRIAHRDAIERIKVMQFFFDTQWQQLHGHARRSGVRLFGDIPFYIALDSADAWARKDLLRIDRKGRPTHVAGVPPDYFSKNGQLWGNPLYDWKAQASRGHDWWLNRLAQAAGRCDMVRIDHFRGFESFWSVPHGARTARKGAWVEGPGDALFDAARKAMGTLPLVAEDLGYITDAVTALRRRHGIPGMRVLQFDLADPAFKPGDIPPDCMCFTATHDNDTTHGWFSGKDPGRRTAREIAATRKRVLRMTGGRVGSIHLDIIRLAFSTKAQVAIAPMQDYLGLDSRSRLNTPGSRRNNWRWRLT